MCVNKEIRKTKNTNKTILLTYVCSEQHFSNEGPRAQAPPSKLIKFRMCSEIYILKAVLPFKSFILTRALTTQFSFYVLMEVSEDELSEAKI